MKSRLRTVQPKDGAKSDVPEIQLRARQESLETIAATQQEMLEQLAKVVSHIEKKHKGRDFLLSVLGVLVALMGSYITYRHNSIQHRVDEAKTLQALLPFTAGKDANADTRRAAVGVVKAHRSPTMSVNYALNLSDLGEHTLAVALAHSALKLALETSWLTQTYEMCRRATATTVVNSAESELRTLHRSVQEGKVSNTEAQKEFDQIWRHMSSECAQRELGVAGQKCLEDRQRGGKFDWFQNYRDQFSKFPTK